VFLIGIRFRPWPPKFLNVFDLQRHPALELALMLRLQHDAIEGRIAPAIPARHDVPERSGGPMPAVKNTYTNALRATTLVAVGSALAVALALLLDARGIRGWRGLMAGAPLLLASLIALPILWFSGSMERRQLQALLDGGFLVHWTYSREECLRFAGLEWKRTLAKAPVLALSAAGVMIVCGAGLSLIEEELSLLNGLLFGAGVGVAMGILVGILFCAFGWLARRACLAGPAEAYVGSDGVYQHGRYVSWDSPWMTLQNVRLEPGEPQALCFEVEGSRGGKQELRVAVPADQQAEAKHLLTHFPAAGAASSARNRRNRRRTH
jgi:hypothetical protein